jgi:hypothetical protein
MKNQMMKGSSSDYIKVKKQNAIYNNINSNAQFTGFTVNPLKRDGYYYNNMLNVNVPNQCSNNSCSGGILSNARSYQLRLDFKQGKYYNNYTCNCDRDIINNLKNDSSCIATPIDGENVIKCLCSPCAFN